MVKLIQKLMLAERKKETPLMFIIKLMKLCELFFRIRIEKVCICIVHIKFKFFFSGTVVLKVLLLVKLQ